MSSSAFTPTIPIGYGIVVPGSSPGLVSASGVPANTTGSTISAGFIGESIPGTLAASIASLTTGVIANIGSITLNQGNYLIIAAAYLSVGAGASLSQFRRGISTANNTVVSGRYLSGIDTAVAYDVSGQYIEHVTISSASTQLFFNILVRFSGGTVGTDQASSILKAIRIA